MKHVLDNYRLVELKKKKAAVHRIVDGYFKIKGWDDMPIEFYKGANSYSALSKYAKLALDVFGSEEAVLSALSHLDAKSRSEKWNYSLATLTKNGLKYRL